MQQHKERFEYLMNTLTRFRPTSDVGQGRIFLGAQVITCNRLFIGSKSNGWHLMWERIYKTNKAFMLTDLVVAVSHNWSLKDLNQSDQFREWTVKTIWVYFCSSRKKGLDHHIIEAVSKHHLKDLWFAQMVVIIQLFQRGDLFVEHRKRGFQSSHL